MFDFRGAAMGAAGMMLVGGSVAVSADLSGAPVFTAQALRYAVACLLLLAFARARRRPVPTPRRAEWLWLAGITATGLILFNVALVDGSAHAEPAVLGVAVACVPLLLAVIGPIQQRRRPRAAVVAAALLVTAGAVCVEGTGRTDAAGVGWAAVVFACEAAFTLLAVPVLGRLGPVGVSVHTTWLAAVGFAGLGLVREGPAAVARFDGGQWWAMGYLAFGVTAAAFVLWYSCVERLTASRAGLLTGIAPICAAATGVLLGAPRPALPVWLGIAVVAAGLVVGLRGGETPAGVVGPVAASRAVGPTAASGAGGTAASGVVSPVAPSGVGGTVAASGVVGPAAWSGAGGPVAAPGVGGTVSVPVTGRAGAMTLLAARSTISEREGRSTSDR